MAQLPTHVVARSASAVPTRTAREIDAPPGPELAGGEQVAVLVVDGDAAHVERTDGTQLWMAAGALTPLPAAAVLSAANELLATEGVRHPPPPAPGAHAPVQVAGIRLTTQLVGGALLVVAAFLPWTSQFMLASTAWGVPARVLVQGGSTTGGGFVKLPFLLLPLAALVVVAGLRVLPNVVGQAAGAVSALVALVFIAQLQRTMGKFYAATVFGILGIGVYVTLLGGLLAAVATRGERA